MGRIVAIVLIVLVLGAGSLVFMQRQGLVELPLPGRASNDEGEAPAFETLELSRGSIASTVSATGNIQPEAEVSLAFDSTGRVRQVMVAEGQAVREGQLLAQLDVEEFQLARDEALVGQKIAQARLNKLLNNADEADIALARARIALARAQIASAQANLVARRTEYRVLNEGIATADRQALEAEVAQMQSAVEEARFNLAQTKDIYRVSDEEIDAAEERLFQAVYRANAAQARLDSAIAPPTDSELTAALYGIAQAEEGVQQAAANLLEQENALRDLEDGADVSDIDIARSELEQARISYERALLNIENAQLLAPRDGIISNVNVRVGELYTGTSPAMILADLQSYHMQVRVDEIDVRQVQLNQQVKLVLDALPDSDIWGRVTKISPTAEEMGSTITYEVEIVPDPTDAPLRDGMSATAIITTAQVDNVLLIPNRFVRFDRDQNKFFVYKVINSEPVLAEIRIGLRNERESQVLAGLTDADQVAILSIDRERQLRTALFGGS